MENAITQSDRKEVAMRAESGISASDLLIPRLLLMQNTSEAVGAGTAKLGDILNSQTSAIIGGFDKPVELIPLKMFKTWRVMDTSEKQAQYVREEPVTYENESRAWEGHEDIVDRKTGKEKKSCPVRYDLGYSFFALLTTDIEEGAFPVVLTFRRTSAKAGKALNTELYKRSHMGQAVFSRTVLLKVGRQKKETNTWAVFEIHGGTKVTPEQHKAAQDWHAKVETLRDRIQEEPEQTEFDLNTPAPAVVVGSGSGVGVGSY